jgi:hypothetical protein
VSSICGAHLDRGMLRLPSRGYCGGSGSPLAYMLVRKALREGVRLELVGVAPAPHPCAASQCRMPPAKLAQRELPAHHLQRPREVDINCSLIDTMSVRECVGCLWLAMRHHVVPDSASHELMTELVLVWRAARRRAQRPAWWLYTHISRHSD